MLLGLNCGCKQVTNLRPTIEGNGNDAEKLAGRLFDLG